MGNSPEIIPAQYPSAKNTLRLTKLMAWKEELEVWCEEVAFFQKTLRLGLPNTGANASLPPLINKLTETKEHIIPALESILGNALLKAPMNEGIQPGDFRFIEDQVYSGRQQWIILKRQLLPYLGNLQTISFW